MRILIYVLIMLLCACANIKQYLYDSAQTVKCKQVCRQHLQQCRVSCKRDAVHCAMVQLNTTTREYAVYVRQQTIQGRSIALERDAFRDPLVCRKLTCDCDADKLVCMQMCTGKIRQRLESILS